MSDLANLYIKVDSTGVVTASKDLNKLEDSSRKVEKATDSVAKSFNSLKGVLAGVTAYLGIRELERFSSALFDAGVAASRLRKSYEEILGSAARANKEFNFLREASDKLGQNFYVLAESYKGLSAASKGTVLQGQATRDIFIAITKASSSLGLSAESLHGVFVAIQQMMSKGKVTAEELRGQLSERLPGAFNLMAQAMGVSTAKLDMMLQKGQVLASDALPKLADLLSKRYSGATTDATRASNKLQEAWMDLKVEMANSGFLDSATKAIKNITEALKDPEVQRSLKDFATNLGAVIENISAFAKYAGLRSVFGTMAQASELSKQGLVDMTEFAKMGFVERQRLVDDIIAKQKEMSTTTYKIGPDTAGYADYLNDYKDAAVSSTSAVKELSKEEERREKNIQEYIKNLEQEIEFIGLDETAKERLKAREMGLTGERLKAVDAMIAQKAAQEALWKTAQEANDAIADNIEDGVRLAQEGDRRRREEAEEDAEKALANHKKSVEKQEKEYAHYLERIQDATADAFYDMFTNTEDGFKGLFDRIEKLFLRSLAEMAAQAIAKPIIVPIVQTVGGVMGLQGYSGGATGGASGGAGGSGGWTDIAGQGASWLYNKYGGGGTAAGASYNGLGSTVLWSTPGATTWAYGLESPLAEFGVGMTPISTAGSGAAYTLGAAASNFGYGALGYSTIGKWVGLPQSQYSGLTAGVGSALGGWAGTAIGASMAGAGGFAGGAAAGATTGAEAGSVYPGIGNAIGAIIGAIIGGIAGSLFGGKEDAKQINLSNYPGLGQEFSMYQMPAASSWTKEKYQEFVNYSGMNDYDRSLVDLRYSTVEAMGKVVSEVYTVTDDYIETLPEELGVIVKKGIASLKFSFADIDTRISRNTGEEDVKRDVEYILKEAGTMMTDAIGEVFSSAVSEYLGGKISGASGTLGMLSSNHMLAKYLKNTSLFNTDYTKAEGAKLEDYVAGASGFLQSIDQIQAAWDAVTKGFDRAVNPLSDYASGLETVTNNVNASIEVLKQMGFNEQALMDARKKGDAVVEHYTKTYMANIKASYDEIRGLWEPNNKLDIIAARYGTTREALGDRSSLESTYKAMADPQVVQAIADIFTKGDTSQVLSDLKTVIEAFLKVDDSKAIDTLATDLEELNTRALAVATSFKSMVETLDLAIFKQGGGAESQFYTDQINAILEIRKDRKLSVDEIEDLTSLTGQWFSAAMSEAVQVAQAWKTVADTTKQLIQSIEEAQRGIKYSALNVGLPTAKFSEASQDYAKLFQKAQTGGASAIQEYLAFAPTYLQTAQDKYKSSTAYQSIYASTMSDMDMIKSLVSSKDYQQLLLEETQRQTTEFRIDYSRIASTLEGLTTVTRDGFIALGLSPKDEAVAMLTASITRLGELETTALGQLTTAIGTLGTTLSTAIGGISVNLNGGGTGGGGGVQPGLNPTATGVASNYDLASGVPISEYVSALGSNSFPGIEQAIFGTGRGIDAWSAAYNEFSVASTKGVQEQIAGAFGVGNAGTFALMLDKSKEMFGFAEGGVVSGPNAGYPVLLHGTEKVTPMRGGRDEELEELRKQNALLQQLVIYSQKGQTVTAVISRDAVRQEANGVLTEAARRGRLDSRGIM